MLTNIILTPTAVWQDFNDNLPLKDTRMSEEMVDGITYNEVYFSGRQTDDGRVLVYGVYAHNDDGKKHNAILIIPDVGKYIDLGLIMFYAQNGYNVLMLDYRGECNGVENYTNYPSDVKYANLKFSGRNLDFADQTAKQTCWYEWVAVFRYGLSFLKKQLETSNIGVLGIRDGANIMWQLIASDSRIKCAVALYGMGWRAYKGLYKYKNNKLIMDEERYRFIAGVDAHSYAQYVKCPVLYETGTNSAFFDCDRAHDTLKRMPENIDKMFYYSPRREETLDYNATRNIELFFAKHLNGSKVVIEQPPQIDFSLINETVNITVKVEDSKKIRSFAVYVCENNANPSTRNWINLSDATVDEEGTITAKYNLCNGGVLLTAFCNVEYKNGISLSSPIISKKTKTSAVYLTNLIYSGRNGLSDWSYLCTENELMAETILTKPVSLEMQKGAMNISGINSKHGIYTYKISENCVKLISESIFLLDICCSKNIVLSAVLRSDIGKAEQCEYHYEVRIPSGEVWQNVLLNLSDFKSKDGLSIKHPETVEYLSLCADEKFLINNVLII